MGEFLPRPPNNTVQRTQLHVELVPFARNAQVVIQPGRRRDSLAQLHRGLPVLDYGRKGTNGIAFTQIIDPDKVVVILLDQKALEGIATADRRFKLGREIEIVITRWLHQAWRLILANAAGEIHPEVVI